MYFYDMVDWVEITPESIEWFVRVDVSIWCNYYSIAWIMRQPDNEMANEGSSTVDFLWGLDFYLMSL